MSPEHLIIDFLIAGHTAYPYETRIAAQEYLYQRVSLDRRVKRKTINTKSESVLGDFIKSDKPAVEDVVHERFIEEKIRELAETSGLSPRQKQVFDLWCLKRWTPSEISKFLGFKRRQDAQNSISVSVKKIAANPNFPKIFGLESA